MPAVTGEERGIVTAASYEAKALGITRGLPIFRVRRDYPSVIILPGDYLSYVEYSRKMFDIVRKYADDVEEYSIDECFADLTGLHKPLKMSYKEIAQKIKKEINEELNLSISVGVAPTKVLAKVASKWIKPNGLTIISMESIKNFLDKTPIEKIWGIGRRTALFLQMRGIKNAEEFAGLKREWIEDNTAKPYQAIWAELNGVNVMEVDPNPKTSYSSMQRTRSFTPPTNDPSFLLSQLSKNMEEACVKARHYGLVPRKAGIFLKTQKFRYVFRTLPVALPTNAPEILMSLARLEFHKMHENGVLYRTTGVFLQDLVPASSLSLDIFGNENMAGKFEEVHRRIDILENKTGKKLIHLASSHKAIKKEVKGTDGKDLDRDLLFL